MTRILSFDFFIQGDYCLGNRPKPALGTANDFKTNTIRVKIGELVNTGGLYSMFGIGLPELLVILLIVLIIFGAGRIPEIGAGIGKGIQNFKKAASGEDTPPEEIENKKDE